MNAFELEPFQGYLKGPKSIAKGSPIKREDKQDLG